MALLDIEADFQRIFGFSLTEGKQWLVKSGTNLIFAAIVLFVGFWLGQLTYSLPAVASNGSNSVNRRGNRHNAE